MRILMQHVEVIGALPAEQKALRKGARGCLDALTIDQAIADEVRIRSRNLEVTWVDYQKAYDRVPHRWVNKMLEILAAPECVQRTLLGGDVPSWFVRGMTYMIPKEDCEGKPKQFR